MTNMFWLTTFVVMGTAVAVLNSPNLHLPPQQMEFSGGTAYTVTNEPVKILTVEGPIRKGDFERFQDALYAYQPDMISLNSTGGLVNEAIAMGRLIRSHNIETIVWPTNSCASACVWVFAGGTYRTATEDTLLIHQSRFRDQEKMSTLELHHQKTLSDQYEAEFLTDMGVHTAIQTIADFTPHSEITSITADEMQWTGIVTHCKTKDGNACAPPKIEKIY